MRVPINIRHNFPQEAVTKVMMIYASLTNRHLDTMVISTVTKKKKNHSFSSLFYLICEFSRECAFLHMQLPHGQARAEAWSL